MTALVLLVFLGLALFLGWLFAGPRCDTRILFRGGVYRCDYWRGHSGRCDLRRDA